VLSHGPHRFTRKLHLAYLYLISIQNMAPPHTDVWTSNCSLLLIYLAQKDDRLSRPGWLTYSGWFTHISDHPSAAGRVQDRESSPVKDQRSTIATRNQPVEVCKVKHNLNIPFISEVSVKSVTSRAVWPANELPSNVEPNSARRTNVASRKLISSPTSQSHLAKFHGSKLVDKNTIYT